MLSKTKTAIWLVLCLLLTSFSPPIRAVESADVSPILTYDQIDGHHVDGVLNLSGLSTVPLTSVEISVWNISEPDQWSELSSSPYLNSVVPFNDESTDSTMWAWTHVFDLSTIDCTCYVDISLMEQTDLVSFGLIVYAGENHHRPVLRPSSSIGLGHAYSTQIYNSNSIDLAYDVLLPPYNNQPIAESTTDVLPNVRLCPVSNGICLDNYTSITVDVVSYENDLEMVLDVNGNSIQDGFYLLQIQIQDQFLTLSNNLSQYILIDQNKPTVSLTAVDKVLESESIFVDIDVNDGYTGSSFVITWSITQPDGTPRAVLDSEILDDSRLDFQPTKSGLYSVNALVRDLGGHLVVVNHNVSVENIVPQAVVRYDGFLVQDGSEITVPESGTWTFSANDSTDSENDRSILEYYWYVDGKSLLSGKPYLTSSDVQSQEFKEIRVEIVDDDGASTSFSFKVNKQQSDSSQSLADTSLASVISLFFILFVGILVYMRQRSQNESSSGFVKWTERGKGPKN